MLNKLKDKIIKIIKNPLYIFYWLDKKRVITLNDKKYLEILYKKVMNENINWTEPNTFNEKLQWLKLYDRNPEYIKMVDKYEVKKHIATVLGKEYIIPTLGIWSRFQDIDFENLPNQFVLKCTHDSGSTIVCKDKKTFNYEEAKKKIKKALKTNYYYLSREWPYKNIKPRIIAEEYMADESGKGLNDYKFYCFNGKCNYVMLCTERETGDTKFYYYDKEWNLKKEMSNDGKKLKHDLINAKPQNIEKMFKIVESLSKGIKFVRIDLYNVRGKIYFGEFTFYPGAGFDTTRSLECEKILTKELKLKDLKGEKMRKIVFLISGKENEKRRAIVLEHINKVKNKEYLYFQEGYGNEIGYTDKDITNLGCKVATKKEILNCDIICDPKIGDSELLKEIKDKIIFGWIHATQNYDITQLCIDNKLTAYAWEKMYNSNGHIFSKNNEIAGEAAILHAMIVYGKTFLNMKAAILGNGNTSKGAQRMLNKFGVDTTIYTREMENEFKNNINQYDIIVNCILWDVSRKDHIIYKEDLKKIKPNAIIIDVSCDKNGGIETSIPTTVENPAYIIDGIMHYVVDHTPTLLYRQATYSISNEVTDYLDDLIENRENKVLEDALIIKEGKIIDSKIIEFQNRE